MGNINSLFLVLALVFGIAHAIYVYRQELAEFRFALQPRSIEIRFRASYYAMWTLVLWVVLGRYIVGYWLLAIIPYLVARTMGKTLRIRPAVAVSR